MAKPIKSKMVLDIGEFSATLGQAERRYRKTVAELEKGSGLGINKMRLDLGSNAQEFAQSRRDLMGIRGGPDERYTGMFAPTQRRASEYAAALGENKPKLGLEGVAKAAGLAAAGIEAASIATKVWNGDITGAAESIKTLPFGIGSVATALESILGTWTGISGEIELNNQLAKAQEESAAAINEQLRTRMKLEKEHREFLREQGQAARLAGMEGAAKEQQQLEDTKQASLRKIEEDLKREKADALAARNKASLATRPTSSEGKFSLGAGYARSQAANEATRGQREVIQANYLADVEKAEQRAEEKRAAIESRYAKELHASKEADKRKGQEEEERKNEQQRRKEEQYRKEENDKARQARQAASEVAAVEAEIAAKILEAQGRRLDAERVRLKDHYRQRIEAAREAGNTELASRLEMEGKLAMGSLGVDQARTTEHQARTAEQVIRGRFALGGMSAKREKISIDKGDPQQTEYLRKITAALERGIVGRAA